VGSSAAAGVAIIVTASLKPARVLAGSCALRGALTVKRSQELAPAKKKALHDCRAHEPALTSLA